VFDGLVINDPSLTTGNTSSYTSQPPYPYYFDEPPPPPPPMISSEGIIATDITSKFKASAESR